MDAGHIETEKKLKALETRIRKQYKKAAEEMEEKVAKYYADFARKDAAKQSLLKSGALSKDEYDKWRFGQLMVGKRWEEMRDTLAEDLLNVDKIAMSMVGDYMPEAYAINHNYSTFQVEHDSLVDTSYTLYDRQTVERLNIPTDMLPKPKIDIPKDLKWSKAKLTSAMMQGILQGESIPKIAQRLSNVSSMSGNAAIRNARTMTTAAQNKGRVDGFKRAKSMGIDVVEVWLATLDGRTRHSHRMMDGEKKEVEKRKFSNGLRFPGDPEGRPEEVYNCRCTLIGEVEGVDMNVSDLTERDSKLGEMSYEQWKKDKAISKHYGESVKHYEDRRKKEIAARRTSTMDFSLHINKNFVDDVVKFDITDWADFRDRHWNGKLDPEAEKAYYRLRDAMKHKGIKGTDERAKFIAATLGDAKETGYTALFKREQEALAKKAALDDERKRKAAERAAKKAEAAKKKAEAARAKAAKSGVYAPRAAACDYLDDLTSYVEKEQFWNRRVQSLASAHNISLDEARKIVDEGYQAMVDNCELARFTSKRTLESIVKDGKSGRIMNQIEQESRGMRVTSGGMNNPRRRAQAEANIFNAPKYHAKGYDDANRPIYGWTMPNYPTEKQRIDAVKGSNASWYGRGDGIVVIWDKQKVFNSTTVTIGDSLGSWGSFGATKLNDVHYQGGSWDSAEICFKAREAQVLGNVDGIYDCIIELANNCGYWEHQIHGAEMHTIECMKQVIMPKGNDVLANEIRALGIDVIEY